MEQEPKAPSDHLYWARSSSINAAPPPKPISAEEAKKMEASSSGASAWNKSGSTWEEKKIDAWAFEILQDTLVPEMAYQLPMPGVPVPALPASETGGGELRVSVRALSCDSVSGEATYVMSRGKQKVLFELKLKIKLEMEVFVDAEMKTILTGMVTLPELSNDDLSDAKMPSGCKCTCEQTGWKPFFEQAAKASWAEVVKALEALVSNAKQKWA